MLKEFVDSTTKGLPHTGRDISLGEIAANGWNLLAEDLPLPLAVLRHTALENNRVWMRRFLEQTGSKLAPHGKTTMSPGLFRLQMADGAWAITLATMQQVRVARQAGIDRVLMANELVCDRDIAYILEELCQHPSFEFYCLVDSLAGVQRLAAASKARRIERPIRLLLEMGYRGGRTGCRDLECALRVAHEVSSAEPYLTLCGVEGFEGLFGSSSSVEAVPKVRRFLEYMVEAVERIDREGLFRSPEIILSAGGSAYYDLVAEIFSGAQLSRKASIVLRSGCYLTHDAGSYQRLFHDVCERSTVASGVGGGFQNALEVWAYVISVPESGRAILGAGRRDFGHDAGFPVPLKYCRPGKAVRADAIASGCEIVTVNDQHAHMQFPPELDMRLGDLIGLGVSHPCTTLDKWQLLYVVDDDYTIRSALRTYF
jgi:D-serine dehydratase